MERRGDGEPRKAKKRRSLPLPPKGGGVGEACPPPKGGGEQSKKEAKPQDNKETAKQNNIKGVNSWSDKIKTGSPTLSNSNKRETAKQQVVSITYEEIGLFPRSFNRVFDRFFKQLFFDVENLVIQEYRFYRYLFLTTVKCVFILIFIPFLINFVSKNYLVRPITEFYWNSKQPEIFLNSYMQKRAFNELKDFEEKIYFESLILPDSFISTLQDQFNLQNSTSIFTSDFSVDEKQKEKTNLVTSQKYLSNSSISPEKDSFLSTTIDLDLPESFNKQLENENLIVLRSKPDAIYEKSENRPPGFEEAQRDKAKHRPQSLIGGSDQKSKTGTHNDFKQKSSPLVLVPEANTFLANKKGSKSNSSVSSTNSLIQNTNESSIFSTFEQNYDETPTEKLCVIQDENNKNVNNVVSKSRDNACITSFPQSFSEKTVSFSEKSYEKLLNQYVQKRLQNKTLELAIHYNEESIEAITNFFADFISFTTLCFLLLNFEIQINITKSFLLEVFFGLDDSKKSLFILFVTDLLVGYHSPNIWELFFSSIFDHYGLPENETTIFLLVATLPVLLDVLFKYLIFRHLNRASPATVATYHAMIE